MVMGRSLKIIAILAFASLAVTACGKRGALDTPGATEGEESGKQPKSAEAKKPAPHREFILDGMLR
jgi:predicted small lipoprotein YifL